MEDHRVAVQGYVARHLHRGTEDLVDVAQPSAACHQPVVLGVIDGAEDGAAESFVELDERLAHDVDVVDVGKLQRAVEGVVDHLLAALAHGLVGDGVELGTGVDQMQSATALGSVGVEYGLQQQLVCQ